MSTSFVELWVYLAATPLFGLTATLAVYVVAVSASARLGHPPTANPVLWSVLALALLLTATGTPYPVYFSGAQFIHFLLGPAVVALAWPLWQRRAELRARAGALLVAALLGGAAASASAVAIGWAVGLPVEVLASLAPKSVTAPVAMGVAAQLGGIPALAAVFAVLTGLIGLTALLDLVIASASAKWAILAPIFVPMLANEIKAVAEDLELIIDPDLAFIAEVDGKAMGMCILLPNVNEILHELRGSHWIVTMLKLVWRLKVQKRPPRSARLMLLGIRGELRNVRKYMGLSAAMYAEVATRGKAKGYTWGELSWTREDDSPINAGIANMGAKVYKKYRIYQKAL
jgi:putative effector of murein hydrolase